MDEYMNSIFCCSFLEMLTFRKKYIGGMRVHKCIHETLFYRSLSLF